MNKYNMNHILSNPMGRVRYVSEKIYDESAFGGD